MSPTKQVRVRASQIQIGGRSLRSKRCVICLGTYWYHSHVNAQYCDGLRGAFVVYDPSDPNAGLYDIDDGMASYSG